jgi:hypothetical protein
MAPQLAHSQMVSSTQNPEQIAILHWYSANRASQTVVGSGPDGVAFDGANISVANNSGDLGNRKEFLS